MVKRNLEDIYPKDSLYLAIIYAFTMFAILFGLSWSEVIIAVVIDNIAFMLVKKPELVVFYRLFPKFKLFKDDEKDVRALDTFEKQNSFYNLLASYPEKRGLYVFLGSLLKVLPVGIYISYVSQTSPSFWTNLLLFYVADVFIILYVSGLLFIQLHRTTSVIMDDLRTESGWMKNYRDLKLTSLKDRFSSVQNILLLAMLVNLFGLVLYTNKLAPVSSNYLLLVLFISGIVCIGRVQLLFQDFFKKALLSSLDDFNGIVDFKKKDALTLHTSPVISGFEYSFNQLSLKLEEREKEISEWLKHESSQFHLKALGEVTAMVAHDMKTPLHIMSMSLEMLKDESLSEENKTKYREMLERNLLQSISFSKTLMAYVRGDKEVGQCLFGDIHHHLLDLFRTQFNENDFNRICFNVSDEAKQIELKISRLDAMHIFYNLYQNALKAALGQGPNLPTISIWSELNENEVDIFIQNSGEPLKVEVFNNLISFERFTGNEQFYQGLGLRLTNSILNHLKGKLAIVPVENQTCLKVTLPGTTQLVLRPSSALTEPTVQ